MKNPQSILRVFLLPAHVDRIAPVSPLRTAALPSRFGFLTKTFRPVLADDEKNPRRSLCGDVFMLFLHFRLLPRSSGLVKADQA